MNGEKAQLDFILKVLATFEEIDSCDDLIWHVKDGQVSFSVDCNDLFCWGCSDTEDLTEENFHLLEEAIQEIKAIPETNVKGMKSDQKEFWGCWPVRSFFVPSLFCAKSRKARPQGAAFPSSTHKDLWHLFDACGPEKPVQFGNPYRIQGRTHTNTGSEMKLVMIYDVGDGWTFSRERITPIEYSSPEALIVAG